MDASLRGTQHHYKHQSTVWLSATQPRGDVFFFLWLTLQQLCSLSKATIPVVIGLTF